MVNKVKTVSLDYLQLHGNESIDTIKTLKSLLPDTGIIKAFNIKELSDFVKVDKYLPFVDLIILDSSNPGSGTSFDWNLIPDSLDKSKCLLSGGIGPDNVEKALNYGFAGLDLNSKLEKVKASKMLNLSTRLSSLSTITKIRSIS